MEGLSAAASGIAVVSIAVQLAESSKKLCDFWKSIKEAPENIRAISVDLELLSSVLTQIALETQHVEPDATLIAALNSCYAKVKTLTTILNEIEPGFASTRFRVRKWTALKAALKHGELMKFQENLERLKGTLLLVQQNQYSRLSRNRQNSLERSLATITHHISSLSVQRHVEIAGKVSSTVSDHLRAEEQDVTDLCARNVYLTQSDYSVPEEPWSVSRRQVTVKRTLERTTSVMEAFLGTIRATSTTILQPSGQIGDLIPDHEQDQYEYRTSYTISPAQWLTRLGFHYGLRFGFLSSSTHGWKNTLQTFCPVPDDALIFDFCRQGNVPAVRSLLSGGYASVKDTDSWGFTPLHFAAQNYHPELCEMLKRAGADMTTVTHDAKSPIVLAAETAVYTTRAMRAEVFDTFRLFHDSMDFLEENDDGWEVLLYLCNAACEGHGCSEAKSELLLGMLRLSSFELKTNCSENLYGLMLGWVLKPEPKLLEAADFLLNRGGPSVIDAVDRDTYAYPLLHERIANTDWTDHVSVVVARGPDLHRQVFDTFYTPCVESPTTLAMYSSWALADWLHALVNNNVDLEKFIDQELELNSELHPGWEKDTLLDLFTHGARLDFCARMKWKCSDCIRGTPSVRVQPYWRHLLDMFKEGLHPYDPAPAASEVGNEENPDRGSVVEALTSSSSDPAQMSDFKEIGPLDSLDELAFESGSEDDISECCATISIGSDCLYGKHDIVCMKCWLHYERTGTRGPPEDLRKIEDSSSSDDASEDEYSPFHIHS